MSNPIDPRIRNLSYSSLLTLHNCPREFQLYKLGHKSDTGSIGVEIDLEEDANSQQAEFILDSSPQAITFAYGHIVGQGVQDVFLDKPMNEIIWNAFLMWDCDLYAENTKQNKSFWDAIIAIQKVAAIRNSGYFKDWEVVSYNEKPASELGFLIDLPDGFKYRGFVDCVLQNKNTSEVMVLEVKTNSATNLNPAQYKNSAQAIGYSIVLDAIFPELSSYKVLYLTYLSKGEEWVAIPFDKSYYQRALWINELLLDIETIKLYEDASIYPMHGESCFRFYRECNYYQTCTLATDKLTVELTPEIEARIQTELSEFQIKVTLEDLIRAQLAKDPTKQLTNVHVEIDDDIML